MIQLVLGIALTIIGIVAAVSGDDGIAWACAGAAAIYLAAALVIRHSNILSEHPDMEVRGIAIVEALRATRTASYRGPVIELDVRIDPEGGAQYASTFRGVVPFVFAGPPLISPGSELIIYIDPEKRDTFDIAWDESLAATTTT